MTDKGIFVWEIFISPFQDVNLRPQRYRERSSPLRYSAILSSMKLSSLCVIYLLETCFVNKRNNNNEFYCSILLYNIEFYCCSYRNEWSQEERWSGDVRSDLLQQLECKSGDRSGNTCQKSCMYQHQGLMSWHSLFVLQFRAL